MYPRCNLDSNSPKSWILRAYSFLGSILKGSRGKTYVPSTVNLLLQDLSDRAALIRSDRLIIEKVIEVFADGLF